MSTCNTKDLSIPMRIGSATCLEGEILGGIGIIYHDMT